VSGTRRRLATSEGLPIETAQTPQLCLACGTALSPALVRFASLRCHDCRDVEAPLRSDLVAPQKQPVRPKRRLRLRPAA